MKNYELIHHWSGTTTEYVFQCEVDLSGEYSLGNKTIPASVLECLGIEFQPDTGEIIVIRELSIPKLEIGFVRDMTSRIAELQSALQFYADRNKWSSKHNQPHLGLNLLSSNEHGWTVAEKALAKDQAWVKERKADE